MKETKSKKLAYSEEFIKNGDDFIGEVRPYLIAIAVFVSCLLIYGFFDYFGMINHGGFRL